MSLLSLKAMPTMQAMAALTIRKLDEDVKTRLRVRAAQNGRSMEEEARVILAGVLGEPRNTGADLVASIRAKFGPLGGVDLELPSRESSRGVADFSE